MNVLAAIPGKEVDDDIVARLASAGGKTRLVLIEVAGRRFLGEAVPLLRKAADDPDAQVRAAAVIALGKTIAPGDLAVLIARVADSKTPEEAVVAVKALTTACQRVPDREACAERLTASLSSSPVAAKCRLLEVLAAVGGANALKTVAAAMKDGSPEVHEAASRLLGEWMDMDAAEVLLDLANDGRGRQVQDPGPARLYPPGAAVPMSDEERTKMCRRGDERGPAA